MEPTENIGFVLSDAGRSKSRRPKQRNDCTVVALALARGLSYDAAYEQLAAAGRQCNKRFKFRPWIESQPWAKRISFPAVAGQPRMTPARFVRDYPRGRFILQVSRHVIAVIDGTLIDSAPVRTNRCVYGAWALTF